ncbi:MAG: thioredoxin family protein [Pirellulaceae bacterium]|nr:thioredoxin family protein [Pirellulaceae bacterium]
MRRLQTSVVIGLFILTLGPATLDASIPWMSDVGQAQQIAQQQQRLVLLHFYADWCGPCVRLDREVYPRPDISSAISSNFIPVKIDVQRSPQIARHYGVQSFPTDIVLDPAGRVLHRANTPADAGKYLQILNGLSANQVPPSQVPTNQVAPGQTNPWSPNPASQPNPYYAGPGNQPGAPPTATSQPWQSNNQYGVPAGAPGMPVGAPPTAYYPPQTQSSFDPGSVPSRPEYAPSYANPYVPERPNGGPVREASMAPAGTATPADPASFRGSNPAFSGVAGMRQDGWNSNQPAPAQPAAQPELGLEGFCPVSLAQKETWERGDPRWGAVHRGRTYLFASASHQQQFLADPDRYSPVLSGYDTTRFVDYGEPVEGKRRHGMWFRGKMYLFAEEGSLERFQRSPEYYAQKSHEIMMRGAR